MTSRYGGRAPRGSRARGWKRNPGRREWRESRQKADLSRRPIGGGGVRRDSRWNGVLHLTPSRWDRPSPAAEHLPVGGRGASSRGSHSGDRAAPQRSLGVVAGSRACPLCDSRRRRHAGSCRGSPGKELAVECVGRIRGDRSALLRAAARRRRRSRRPVATVAGRITAGLAGRGVVRLGAGSRPLAYGLPEPRLPWEVSPEMGFREWHRSGDVVLLWRFVSGRPATRSGESWPGGWQARSGSAIIVPGEPLLAVRPCLRQQASPE